MSPEPKVQAAREEPAVSAAPTERQARHTTFAGPVAPPRGGGSTSQPPSGRSFARTVTNSWHGDRKSRTSGVLSKQDAEDASKQAEIIKEFLEAREGSALKAWLLHFDTNGDQKISLNEFIRGLRRLNYGGDVTQAFTLLDRDSSGELSLEEIDTAQASIWRKFCKWCVSEFESAQDMLDRLSGTGEGGERVSEESFVENLEKLGWNGGFVGLIFQSLDVATSGAGYINLASLKWLETEKRRQKRKENAKMKAILQDKRSKAHQRRMAEQTFQDFKNFLKNKYGNLIRAWRCALSEHSLVLSRAELFKSIAAIGCPCDVRLLWQAFDKDDNGTASIEELNPKGAEVLAHFHKFIQENFGTANAAFKAFDKFNCKKLRLPEFLAAVKGHGFHLPAKSLFYGFDLHGHKVIAEDSFTFLDKWKPPAFLVASANPNSADEVKRLLLKTYKNFLKAWRHCLDVDSSNRCSWKEFEEGCKKINFIGDIPGAWRALDDDLSGFITLHEIDSKAAETLLSFKRWADEEFGSVRSAFGVFDSDNSNEVSYREFRRACRAYGLSANIHTLFHALDVEKNGSLSSDEVSFLDDWEFKDVDAAPSEESETATHTSISTPKWQGTSLTSDLTAYETAGPGPAYSIPSTFGASPHVPNSRFRGAYTFRERTPKLERLPWLNTADAEMTPAPVSYSAQRGVDFMAPSKPTWSFGSEVRSAVEPSQINDRSPGPGQYSLVDYDLRRTTGPAVMCLPRRPLRVHPLYRGEPSPRAPPRVTYTVKR